MPDYSIPCPETMRKTLPQVYKAAKDRIFHKLAACVSFSIIIDIWSSKSMLGFIGFTCFAVTPDFGLINCFLGLRQVFGSHTSQAILAQYEEIMKEWNLTDRPVTNFNCESIQTKIVMFYPSGSPSHYGRSKEHDSSVIYCPAILGY